MQEADLIQNAGDFSVCQTPKTDEVFVFPASLEQHRYWILDQVDMESTASNMAIAFRLEGEVNDQLAEQAISELSLRHEALRTTFRMVNGELMQVISEEAIYQFSVSDLRRTSEGERQQRAEALIRDHSHVRINLATGPLFLARLIHIDDQHHFLALTIHHSVCDGWSNGVLVRDFAEFYRARVTGTEPHLADLPFQFADFTEWQKEWLSTDDARQALVFWKEQIHRNVPALDLPCDRPRTARKDGPGDIESLLISPELNTRIKAFCRGNDATMHQVLLAAFQALLSRYTGQPEFLLGSSIANRTQPGMENVVGRFANPQVILANVDRDPTFRGLLTRVSEWSSRAYAYQDLPFSRLMEEFQLELTGATSQFLQVYFVYQRAFMQPHQAGESLKIIPRPSVSGGVNFDMLVSVVEREEGPRVQIEYNTDLFNAERLRDFAALYVRAIDAFTGNSNLRVSELPLLTADEETALAQAGRGKPSRAPRGTTILEAFDRYAAELGEQPAIIAGKLKTSWSTLHSTSLKFAAALEGLGIRSGHTVALRLEPNAETAAAALATLRLGAVVMPVPATTTVEEWNRILVELRPEIALASEAFAKNISNATAFKKLARASNEKEAPPYPQPLHDAVRIIALDASENYYAVAATHGKVATQLHAAAEALSLRSGSSVAVLPAETAVDAWVDLLLPLISGAAAVHITEPTESSDLRTLLARGETQFALASPSQWLRLLRQDWKIDSAVTLVLRGERLPASAAQQLMQAGQSWYLLSAANAGAPVSLAGLGACKAAQNPVAPLPGQQLLVRDLSGHPAPEGVTGELCLEADGRSKPLRTGYLARWGPDSGFEMIGGTDRSLRLNGYQVRLGELEDRLLAYPGVVKARASVQNGPYGTAELIAYIASADGKLADRDEVSRYLRASSPDYLSRAEIVAVTSLPCRLDGAPNLGLLPRQDRTPVTRSGNADSVPPRDELETTLLGIWEEVLGVQGIGIRTSFFTLGGYSLLIVRLFARINKALGTSLPITTIFNAPTIEQLADILRGRKAYSALVPVQAGEGKPPFFLVHSYLLYAGLPSVLGKAYPFYGLRELDNEGEMSIERRVSSYVEAIRSIQPHGPYFFGGWCAAGPLTIETARQLTVAGEEIGLVILFDSWRPGYAEELATQQATQGKVTWFTRQHWKYAFHAKKLRKLSLGGKADYLWAAAWHKVKSVRDAIYLRHWAAARFLSKQFGFALPHFMHNISLDTLNAAAQYECEPFDFRMTLMRATESHYIPGSDPACGWAKIATGGVDVVWAPGNHESMFKEPNLSVVGKMISERLERAQRPPA